MSFEVTLVGHSCYKVTFGDVTILVDPWLTDRLDRLWVHFPRQVVDFDVKSVDGVFITHHHIDHFHPESLEALDRDVPIFVPSPERTPNYGGSGMGFKAIPWILRRLGFRQIHFIEPLCTFEFKGLHIICLPSKVGFPEVTFLMQSIDGTVAFCGDSLLHPRTVAYLESVRPVIDLALVPCHSTSPPEPLLRRKPPKDIDALKAYSRQVFQRNLDSFKARFVAPSAFGWRVDGEDRFDRFDWANRCLFPFTPDEALVYMQETGQPNFALSPGDRLVLRRGSIVPDCKPRVGRIFEDLELTDKVDVPPFVPGDQMEIAKDRDLDGLMATMSEEIIGTRYWLRATEIGRQAQIKLSNGPSDSAVYTYHPYRRDVWQRQQTDELNEDLPYTWLHSGTLQSLLDSELLMSSSFGLWVSTDNLLTQVFHHPKYYLRNHLHTNAYED
jgi:L-ascorbate metabolism protein UlaG (beta-lactamase superfamily)